MACKKCGSDWTTKAGADCKSCPRCCKLKRCLARKHGLFADPVQMKSCKECGAEFLAVGLSQIKRRVLCGDAGCKRNHDRRRKRHAAARRPAGMSAQPRKPKAQRQCAFSECGQRLTKQHHKYCSRNCFFAAVRTGKQKFKGRQHDEWSKFVDWAYQWNEQRPRLRKPSKRKARPKCEHCGHECKPGARRFCSYACNSRWRGARVCACGQTVFGSNAFSRAVCSECKRQAKRRRRKMYGSYRKRCRKYGGFFNADVLPLDVFKRDKWKCHVCGVKTFKVFCNDEPRSATVDHYPIPLSKGGDHDWHNVRCACFRCNSIKRDQWDGQARLPMLWGADP